MISRWAAVAPLLSAALTLTACGAQTSASGKDDGDKLAVVASFYPLQFAAEQIGGSHLAVKTLTKPGAEPHDIELTTQDVASVSEAKLVIYEKGLQGAVDKAVETQAGDHSLDVAPAAKLDLRFQPTVGAAAESSGENAPGSTDPHFWLDPVRYSEVSKAIATRLSTADPAHKADYQKNAKAFEGKLTALSQDFATGLASCKRRDIVTSHAAFGYLAKRFGMHQIAINGLSPHQEPNAAKLGAISTYAKAHKVTTIYAETLVSPAIAQTVAKETGAKLGTLDPIEGLTSQSHGKDYFEVMRTNLKTLQSGQGCS